MTHSIIDAHAHCGIQDKSQAFEDYCAHAKGSGITEVVMFPPVIEIYDRYDPNFVDNSKWQQRRQRANNYLLTVGNQHLKVIPYFFIWNDFAVDQLTPQHQGIKWHRHDFEPVYHYDDPKCSKAIKEILRRNLPVVFEEELANTVYFINEIAVGVRMIIPHMGLFNGGYKAISELGIWEKPNIFADTSLASPSDIMDYIQKYGSERIIFGSDFPFGDPREELEKILRLQIPQEIKEAITGLNVKQMLAGNRK